MEARNSLNRKILFLIVGLSLLCIGLATIAGYYKYRSLSFSTRDYSYYLQFSSNAFNPEASKYYILNPEGRNMFFMRGTDGEAGLHHGIHFEPSKYMTAALYTVVLTPLTPIIFYVLAAFLPIIYVARRFIPVAKYPVLLGLGLVLVLVYPTSIINAVDDLRPFIPLAAAFSLFMVGLIYPTSLKEKIIYMTLLMLVREEALVLSLAGIAYLWSKEMLRGKSHRESKILFYNWLVWCFIVAAYFVWNDYPIMINPTRIVTKLHLLIPAVVIGIPILVFFIRRFWQKIKMQLDLIAFVGLGIVPILFSLVHDLPSMGSQIYMSRYGLVVCVATVLFVFLILEKFPTVFKKGKQAALLATGGFVGIGFLIMQFVGSTAFVPTLVNAYQHTPDAKLVIGARSELDPRTAEVLVSYETQQAFWDFDQSYTYNRLPAAQFPKAERYYPNNELQLIRLLQEKIQYIVVARSDMPTIESLLKKANKQSTIIDQNATYSFLVINR